ncbi:hypothetical protein Sgou_17270 [Streptomyces gougerotii]|uniref:Uncharacterized protein n=2 Tax=Streptomyces diastaticus group TaxID=2849069 RepID=A0A8H9HKX8_9ACTN|nr:hypothetical protein Srut_00990 [Streptomyces rutgersensis]GFH74749.1 hypothetical protein Sdia_55170 [Streptomyces diastaticus subsp. diastaticus]GFH77057.1 hypothetical protein Sgou_17270 [Streptomyces gougerotii]GGU05091.1 hypothetical protein GCM10015534_03860 [Streptomyces diastaticus subsp. diastaticus]GGU66726.1 hypothetical protein GCM10010227_20570 [Streptomyces gougerotii]
MRPRALEHLVHRVARAVHGEAHQVRPVLADGPHGGAVVAVVAGGEEVRGEDGPGQRPGQRLAVGGGRARA